MNAQKVVKEIHARVGREKSTPAANPSSWSSNTPALAALELNELNSLHAACGRLYQIRNLVGQTPPAPNTLRARLGGHLVRLVQRMLFWYTPQIRLFHNDATLAIGSARLLIERQFEMIAALRHDIQTLRRERALIEQRSHTSETNSGPVPANSLPPAFQFALQDYFRGNESQTTDKLGVWLRSIEELTGAQSRGKWLDIGCGRGEWLALAASENRDVNGIDSNPASIETCRSKGLSAHIADAIDHLKSLPDASVLVVTAFHMVEHLPMDVLLTLITEAARVLCPGGVLAIETPDPRNILMGAHHFWNDPTHQRPIPAALLDFVFGYCGLQTVKRLALNPAPPDEHLPYCEVDVIRRVDDHLYGPRDYGLIGRRES